MTRDQLTRIRDGLRDVFYEVPETLDIDDLPAEARDAVLDAADLAEMLGWRLRAMTSALAERDGL